MNCLVLYSKMSQWVVEVIIQWRLHTFALIEHGWHILGISRWTMLWVAHLAIKIQEALKNPQKLVIFGTQLEPTPTWPASESLGLQTTTSSGYTENFETLSASEVRGFFFSGFLVEWSFWDDSWLTYFFLLLVINGNFRILKRRYCTI